VALALVICCIFSLFIGYYRRHHRTCDGPSENMDVATEDNGPVVGPSEPRRVLGKRIHDHYVREEVLTSHLSDEMGGMAQTPHSTVSNLRQSQSAERRHVRFMTERSD